MDLMAFCGMNGRNVIRLHMGNKLGFGAASKKQQNNNFNQKENDYADNVNYQSSCMQQAQYYSKGGPDPSSSLRLLNDKEQDKEKKVVAVIVTLCTSGSYDNLFTSVEQKSMEGTKVEVYACDSHYLKQLTEAFDGKPKDDVSKRLMESVKKVDPDCVVINWECCGGYTNETFQEGNDQLFKFVKKVVDKGHMCMFSDFSLKALVKNWKEMYELGPNPFEKTTEHSGQFEVRFNSGQLKECPSAQLQIVGDMAEGGRCNIHAAGGTIVYCVNSKNLNHNVYKLQVLTVVTTNPAPKPHLSSKIGEFEGSAGHVLLKYPSGGMILTSMGHWVELMKIDTSEKKLFEVAENMYGASEVRKMREEYECMNVSEQRAYIETKGREFVRNQAPCNNMSKKSAW